jgi:uncharacterized membrane protein YqgA involved in biofilm formation
MENTKEKKEGSEMSESIKSHSEDFQNPSTVRQVISEVFVTLSFLFIMVAMGILGYQCYMWLRTGSWQIITLCSVIDIQSNSWIANLDSWYGVNKTIMLFIDLGLSINCFIIGILLVWFAAKIK